MVDVESIYWLLLQGVSSEIRSLWYLSIETQYLLFPHRAPTAPTTWFAKW